MISLADLDFARHAADNFFRARHALAAGGVDVHGAVVFDVNFRAGLRDDAFDGFAARSDERADFLRIDFDRLDAGRVLRQFRPRFIESTAHDLENFRARFFRAENCLGYDFVADAGEFQIELVTGDAGICAAKFEIHVAEMILRTDDVGKQFVALQLSIFAVFGN